MPKWYGNAVLKFSGQTGVSLRQQICAVYVTGRPVLTRAAGWYCDKDDIDSIDSKVG